MSACNVENGRHQGEASVDRGDEVGGEAAAAVVQARSDDSDDDGGELGDAIEVLRNL